MRCSCGVEAVGEYAVNEHGQVVFVFWCYACDKKVYVYREAIPGIDFNPEVLTVETFGSVGTSCG